MVDVVSDVIINYKSVGLDKVGGEIKQASVALDGLVVSATSSEKATASLENRFKSLERTLSTSEGQAAKFAKVQDTVNKAVAQNPELQGRANEVLANAAQRYGQVEKATTGLADAHKGLNSQGQAALHSIRSMVEQVALGISPVQALTGQLNHLTYAATGEGGITGAFKQAGGFLAGMITPMRAVVGGLGAIGVGAAAMAVQSADDFKEMQRSLIGLGARTGTTVQDIKNFAKENASATGLSITQLRSLGMEMTKTGEISIKNLHGMGEAVHGFATLTDTSAKEAGTKLTQLFAGDLDKAVDQLSKTYSEFNPTIRENVRLLELQGNRGAATQLIIDTIAESNRKAAETTSLWAKSVALLGNAYDAVKNKVGPIVAPDLTATPGRLATAQQHLEMVQRPELGFSADEIRVAREEVEKLNAALAKTDSKNAQAAFNDLANKAEAATRSFDPYIAQIEAVERKLAELRQASETIGLTPQQAAAEQGLQNQLQLLHQSEAEAAQYNQRVAEIAQRWQGVGQAVALQLQALQNQLPVIQAITGQQRMAAQAAADYANAIDAGKTQLEASALAAANLEASQAAATTSVKQQIEAMKDSTAMIKAQQNGTEATTAAAIAYKNAIQSGASQTSAAALAAATLENKMAGAASAAFDLGKNLEQIVNAEATLSQVVTTAGADIRAQIALANAIHAYDVSGYGVYPAGSRADYFSTQGQMTGGSFAGRIGETQTISNAYSIAADLVQRKATMGIQTDIEKELGPGGYGSGATSLTGAYDDAIKAQIDAAKNNTNAVDKLKDSTDSLNATNQELLSPYYTQDPRTSHIGFRSQGMALGGYVDVPGSPSTNDNMIATIPVASGERIYIDPMNNRRSTSSGSGMVINISSPINIFGNADKDQFGRTVYQNNQQLAKQVRAATQ
jgi:hypothetical protein